MQGSFFVALPRWYNPQEFLMVCVSGSGLLIQTRGVHISYKVLAVFVSAE